MLPTDVGAGDARERFAVDGFIVLRSAFDPSALISEIERVLASAFVNPDHFNEGAAGNQFRYVPMMSEHTPASVSLADRFALVASDLLGAPVLPGRAKATQYSGSTDPHRDSDSQHPSLGVVCYLEPLGASDGALRIAAGSHRNADRSVTSHGDPVAVPTRPGDAIILDERLVHASVGGSMRRQWRVDYIADGSDAAAVAAWYAGQFSPNWDAGYDVDRYPSFGANWRTAHPEWSRRLLALGAISAAEAEENACRSRRIAASTTMPVGGHPRMPNRDT